MGLIGSIFIIIFFLITLILGFVQPEYNHIAHTVSALAIGKYGWIQIINFYFLAIGTSLVGYSLGRAISKDDPLKISIGFYLLSAVVIVLTLIPTDPKGVTEALKFTRLSLTGKIHFLAVLGVILFMPFLLLKVVNRMNSDSSWKKIAITTKKILVVNLALGLGWYLLVSAGLMFAWKGIVQKIVVLNTLAWLVAVGLKSWKQIKKR